MKIIKSVSELANSIKTKKREGVTVCLVPTMGNLHQGHLSLVKKAKSVADVVVVSIFVNPLQFNDKNDLTNYPRTLEADIEKLSTEGVDILFTPEVSEVYGSDEEVTYVNVLPISNKLEGASRPGHFQGVSTIVSKLFNMTMPDMAVFGEKDYQQLLLIKQMVRNLNYQIEILSCATEREPSGLAMSSRNNRLSNEAKQIAPRLYQQLKAMKQTLEQSPTRTASHFNHMIKGAKTALMEQGFSEVEIDIQDSHTLDEVEDKTHQAIILIAARLEQVRLIDNILVTLQS